MSHVTPQEIEAGCSVIETTVATEFDVDPLDPLSRLVFVGCGSSYWTGVIAEKLCSSHGIDARTLHSSEFNQVPPPNVEERLVVAYSQSGETTETVAAMERARAAGARTVAVTNVEDSTLDRLVDHTFVVPAGREEAVLATKSVDGAVALTYALVEELTGGAFPRLSKEGERCRAVLETCFDDLVEALDGADRAYVLGRGIGYGLAGEAATKLVEGALVHATALPALEIAHGPMANVENVPVLLIASEKGSARENGELLETVEAAGGEPYVFAHRDTEIPEEWPTYRVPASQTCLPLLKAVQRLAYLTALHRDTDPDSPSSLSKHVEWESVE